MKRTGVFEKDFSSITLATLADRVMTEASQLISIRISAGDGSRFFAHKNVLLNTMVREFQDCYEIQSQAKDGTFFKIKTPTQMEDAIVSFMRHWLSTHLKRVFPKYFAVLPKAFVNGQLSGDIE